MKRNIFLICGIVVALLFLISCAGISGQKSMTLTERAKYSFENTRVDSTLIERQKVVQVFKIMRSSAIDENGKSVYEKIRKLDIQKEWSVIDSVIGAYCIFMDINNNPDTRENEWIVDMKKRIKYCDTYFGEWYRNDDKRAYVVIQLGIDGIVYRPPFEAKCINDIGRIKKTGSLCNHCQISYPSLGIYIELQGNLALDYFNEVVAWVEQGNEPSVDYNSEARCNETHNAKQKFLISVTNRQEPPSYNPLPGSEKDFKAAWRLFKRQISTDQYEVWSVISLPFKQFDPDSLNNINFIVKFVIWSLDGILPEIVAEDTVCNVTTAYSFDMKGGQYLTSFKTVLSPGRWKLVITPTEGKNKTIYSMEVEVPNGMPQNGLSDILLFVDQLINEPVRIGQDCYSGLPFSTFRSEHVINALVTPYGKFESDSSLVVWYLHPVEKRIRRVGRIKENNYTDSLKWIHSDERNFSWEEQEFPLLKFMDPDDIILGYCKTANRDVLELHASLQRIPSGEYDLTCLVVDPKLRGVARQSSKRISVK